MPRLTVAYDVVCPWCWVAMRQAVRLKTDFPTLTLRWVGYELLPEELAYTPAPPDPDADRKPRIPTRFELLLAAEGLTLPERRSPLSNSRLALEGAEHAWEAGKQWEYLEALYHTYWEEDRDISDKAVLTEVAEEAGLDIGEFLDALEHRRFRDKIVEFDDPARAAGIWNVPTWMFPEAWIAEQPYAVVREYAARFVKSSEG